eukprot:1847724-Pyramimonas_sp.AAC.1
MFASGPGQPLAMAPWPRRRATGVPKTQSEHDPRWLQASKVVSPQATQSCRGSVTHVAGQVGRSSAAASLARGSELEL